MKSALSSSIVFLLQMPVVLGKCTDRQSDTMLKPPTGEVNNIHYAHSSDPFQIPDWYSGCFMYVVISTYQK